MKSENFTRLSIDVPSHLHKVLKFHVISHHLNIKNYVLNLIKDDLSEEMEDYLLGHMALESKKEGSLGVKESTKFFKELRSSLLEKPISKSSPRKKTSKK